MEANQPCKKATSGSASKIKNTVNSARILAMTMDFKR